MADRVKKMKMTVAKDILINCKDISFTLLIYTSPIAISKIMLKLFIKATKKAVTLTGNSSGNIHYNSLTY
jgi:hypothetical protein